MTQTELSDADKQAVWDAYHRGQPSRVPMFLVINPRVTVTDPSWNPKGYDFERVAKDPEAHVQISLQHQLHVRRVFHPYTDEPTELPEVWTVGLMVYNIYEAAYFGCPIDYQSGQVPDTVPIYADEDRREAVFEIDVERPLENPYVKSCLDFWHEMERIVRGMSFEGRPVRMGPWTVGTDGPVTVACNLRGTDFLVDLADEADDYAHRLMGHITRAAIVRREAFQRYWGTRLIPRLGNGMADDSVAMLSPEMYRDSVMPHHRAFYEAGDPSAERGLHLCGDVMHLIPLIRRELNVTSFDTGFPIDHGRLRAEVGPEVNLQGGPEVALLLGGSPEAVYRRTAEILTSGVKRGGRFMLREGNNLPPGVPLANLEAMRRACLDHGRYG
jgi:uroporphyrinogen-III decarboxylase